MSKKILVIEDEGSLRTMLSDKLKVEGYTVDEATNGEDGLKKALELKPDLILLDFLLPRLDGVEVIKRLRADEWGKNASIIILSNMSDTEHVSKAVDGEVFDYLIKSSWKLEDIIKKVKDRLK